MNLIDEIQPAMIHDTYRVVEVNAALAQLLRCEVDQLIDVSIFDFIGSEDLKGLARWRMVVLRDKHHLPDVRYLIRRCDGSLFWALVSTTLIEDELYVSKFKFLYTD